MSWESTAVYYRVANQEVQRRLGGLHSAKILLWSFDFAEIESLQEAGNWSEASQRNVEAGRTLVQGGAQFLSSCCNTMPHDGGCGGAGRGRAASAYRNAIGRRDRPPQIGARRSSGHEIYDGSRFPSRAAGAGAWHRHHRPAPDDANETHASSTRNVARTIPGILAATIFAIIARLASRGAEGISSGLHRTSAAR